MIKWLKHRVIAIDRKHPSYLKVPRFIISGGTATLAYIILLIVLTEWFHIWYILSATMGFFVAFFISFFLQKFWTFRDRSRDKIHKQAITFLITLVGGVIVNDLLLYFFVEYIHLHYLIAQIINGVFIGWANFSIYRKIFSYEQRSTHRLLR